LSLLVVPVVFTLVDDTEHALARLLHRLRRAAPAPAAASAPVPAVEKP
jgi:hypothetical protein